MSALVQHACSFLFVPANRPERLPKALARGADMVIADWEDAVAPADKDGARAALLAACADLAPAQRARLLVRINAAGTAWHAPDLRALAQLVGQGVAGAVVPKAESADTLQGVATAAGSACALVPLIESVAGLDAAHTASWVWSLSIGVGLTGLLLSWMTRAPIITAWSTPAAAFLVTALASTPYAEAVGAYLVSAAAFVVLGLSGGFERVIRLIPPGVATGLLAGILLPFGMRAFGGMAVEPAMALLLIVAYVVLKRIAARVGFGDEQNLRRAFQRQYGVTPVAYRERFGMGDGG